MSLYAWKDTIFAVNYKTYKKALITNKVATSLCIRAAWLQSFLLNLHNHWNLKFFQWAGDIAKMCWLMSHIWMQMVLSQTVSNPSTKTHIRLFDPFKFTLAMKQSDMRPNMPWLGWLNRLVAVERFINSFLALWLKKDQCQIFNSVNDLKESVFDCELWDNCSGQVS